MSDLFLVCICVYDLDCSIVDFSSVGYRELLSLCSVGCEILGRVFGVGWKWFWRWWYGGILGGYEEV